MTADQTAVSGLSRRPGPGRRLFDRANNFLILAGGLAVICTCALIFLFLLYVVVPVFRPAALQAQASFDVPGDDGGTLLYALEEQGGAGLRVGSDGRAYFFDARNGALLKTATLLPGGARPAAFAAGDPGYGGMALGSASGGVVLARCRFTEHYTETGREVRPVVEFPFSAEPFPVLPAGTGTAVLGAALDAERATVAAAGGGLLYLLRVEGAEEDALFEEQPAPQAVVTHLPYAGGAISRILVNGRQDKVFAIEEDRFLHSYDISDPAAPILLQKVPLVEGTARVRSLALLSGGFSLLSGDSQGRVRQWFPVRDEQGQAVLRPVRAFKLRGLGLVTVLAPELQRKGFAAADGGGRLALLHASAERLLLLEKVAGASVTHAAFSARAETLLVADAEQRVGIWKVRNPHPEISWQALWGKTWYEGRRQPEWTWQSSSASADFEPKFSFVPLTFGTFKAAVYAMLFSIPLAIFGAISTAYFMAPRLRGIVKPVIELMEALPTVILGFLAGLWFAPFVERHLPAMFLLPLLVIPAVLVAAWCRPRLPAAWRRWLPPGWEALLLVPVVCLAVASAVWLSAPVETAFFDGNMPQWITQHLGLDYDQRNSLVVGIAMGLAVIPTIFSISEDAVFSVPRHLGTGSLALGATRLQTLLRVVLVAALPGIFSAVMIGFGRAIGETMIVIMATGNTPILDFNIFEGFRTLSANIAVELPETEVGSSHYRLLFLSALLLFLVTFTLNTAAELVRLRLRRRYQAL